MSIYVNIWQFMTIYVNIWQYMSTYDNLWQCHMTIVIFCNGALCSRLCCRRRYLHRIVDMCHAMYDNVCQHMSIYDKLWQFMLTCVNIWQCMAMFDNICHKNDNLWQWISIVIFCNGSFLLLSMLSKSLQDSFKTDWQSGVRQDIILIRTNFSNECRLEDASSSDN